MPPSPERRFVGLLSVVRADRDREVEESVEDREIGEDRDREVERADRDREVEEVDEDREIGEDRDIEVGKVEKPIFLCTICRKAFVSSVTIKTHCAKFHPASDSNTSRPVEKNQPAVKKVLSIKNKKAPLAFCLLCRKPFSRKSFYESHMKLHSA